MEALDQREWLYWLIRVRIVVITFLLGIQLTVRFLLATAVQLPNPPPPLQWFVLAIVLWYTLTLFFSILLKIWRDYTTQSYLQLLCDACMVTAIVHVTGGVESYYFFLFPLIVIVAGISLPRPGPYLVASLSFILVGAVLELSYYKVIPSFSQTPDQPPDLRHLEINIFTNLFAFLTVAYLSSTLADSLRKTGTKLTETSGALETLQAFNQNVLYSMMAGLLTTDLEGRVLLLNRAGASILGRPLGALDGRRIEEALPEFAAIPPSFMEQEVNLNTPGGKEKILRVTVSTVTSSDGQSLGSVYFFQDLTELRRMGRELRLQDRMAALGRMAAAIAHEIRNPLTSIAGSVKVFASLGELSEDQRRLVKIVLEESERLDRILADFLGYSRERRYEFQPANLAELLEETLTLMRHRPGAERWKLEGEMPGEPLVAHVDVDAIKQVFWNLCDNAVKAMPQGGTLTVDASVEGARGVIRFRDMGGGLSSRQLEKIFEPFQSGFPSGTGLGLAIVYEIVSAHHGSISAETAPEGGTVFRLTLPLAPQPVPETWIVNRGS